MRKVAAVILWLISLVVLVFGLLFGWELRDGMGPGAVETHGRLAWQRFWDGGGILWLLIWAAPPFILGCFVYPRKRKRPEQQGGGGTDSAEG